MRNMPAIPLKWHGNDFLKINEDKILSGLVQHNHALGGGCVAVDILGLAAIAAGVVTFWQPRHFRTAVGVFLVLYGIFHLGLLR